MPSESLLLAVTSGLGVGLFAGIVSGVCYIVVTGFASQRRPRNFTGIQWHCSVCGAHFRSIEGVLETGRVVTCVKCGANVCRARCSKKIKNTLHSKTDWICQTCQRPETWFKGILRALQPSLEGNKSSKTRMESASIDEIDEDLEGLKKKEKQEIRDFMERLVEAMLGSNIDSASVTRIYNDQKYLPIIGQSPCTAHASLKMLIQRIIQEAIGLPKLEKNDTEIEMVNGEEVANRTYEDLLATAILNKVIENYQEELVSSRANSVISRSNSSLCQNDKEYYFGAETLNAKWENGTSTPAEIDTASISSLDDWVRSDSSVGSTKFVDHMSLTIQQRIEEVSSSDDEGKVKPVLQKSLLAPENEWQENWLMQKRRIGSNASPVPVPMLVPNPSSEAKVLIGDRDAEDTTDLSDVGSDYGDTESIHSIEQVLVNSKKVIGGKNALHGKENLDFVLNGEENIDIAGKEDSSFMSFESQTEKDTEYTEKYATLPRTILKSPTPNKRHLTDNEKEAVSSQNAEHNEEATDEMDSELPIKPVNKHNGYHHEIEVLDDEESNSNEMFKGTYSEREKKKWSNAVELKNNPYSAENLKRRLSDRSTGSISSLFGKDFYIKEASKSADTKVKLTSTDDTPDYTVKGTEEHSSSLSNDNVFTAKPVLIEDDSPPQSDLSFIGTTSPVSPSMLEISSDSDLSVERIYNLPSGMVYVNGKSNKSSNMNDQSCASQSKNILDEAFKEKPEEESIEKCMDFSLESSVDESLQENRSKENSATTKDPEIIDLYDKHLVKDLLGRFSESYPNLAATQPKKGVNSVEQKHEMPLNTKCDHSKQVYSLTARSIPREFREELKKNEEKPRSSSSNAILDEVHSEESLPFPPAKSKIKFFESLKS